ncbi:hypothetical protein GCM10007071_27610 [Marinobacter zhanjiangensis]|uniref:Uncharacterized protein n=1 Tax=Marinobacter zhanjiangensis TaxID=578215 RepID=A0ABQ3B4Y7_9GAMM|nr:hypothetical protein GCM10007071_27610 [Marinobacter zhanjiangensis]
MGYLKDKQAVEKMPIVRGDDNVMAVRKLRPPGMRPTGLTPDYGFLPPAGRRLVITVSHNNHKNVC